MQLYIIQTYFGNIVSPLVCVLNTATEFKFYTLLISQNFSVDLEHFIGTFSMWLLSPPLFYSFAGTSHYLHIKVCCQPFCYSL